MPSPRPARLRAFLAASALLLASLGCLRAPATAPDLKASLKAQADHWDQAIVRKDRTAIAANLAEDFRQIAGSGAVATKPAFIEALMSPVLEIDPYGVEDFDLRIYGDTALLSGRTRMTGRYKGRPFKSHYRYVDVYVRREGIWKVVNVQITELPE